MNIKKLFAVKKPCANCPFRTTGGIPLTEGRLDDIKRTLLSSDQEVFSATRQPTRAVLKTERKGSISLQAVNPIVWEQWLGCMQITN